MFLDGCRRCKVYDHRTAYCKQFPYHIYVSDHVKVELDLSCRGLWTGKGANALDEAKSLVSAADGRIREAMPEASEVYRQYISNAREAGVYTDPSVLRMTVSENLKRFSDLHFIAEVLSAADSEPQMSISGTMKVPKYTDADMNDAARETAVESLSCDDPISLPVYGAEDLSWNVFSVDKNAVEWMEVGDDGEFHHKAFANVSEITIREPDDEGRKVLEDYIAVLNGRDSYMGSVMYAVDANGYEDDMANAYYGSTATAVLDILWRMALLDRFFGTGFGARGMKEAVIFYDMDRLDAPAIGAFI